MKVISTSYLQFFSLPLQYNDGKLATVFSLHLSEVEANLSCLARITRAETTFSARSGVSCVKTLINRGIAPVATILKHFNKKLKD